MNKKSNKNRSKSRRNLKKSNKNRSNKNLRKSNKNSSRKNLRKEGKGIGFKSLRKHFSTRRNLIDYKDIDRIVKLLNKPNVSEKVISITLPFENCSNTYILNVKIEQININK